MFRKSFISFFSNIITVWKVFELLFKKEGREFGNDKSHLCNLVVVMNECVEKTRVTIKRTFYEFSHFWEEIWDIIRYVSG